MSHLQLYEVTFEKQTPLTHGFDEQGFIGMLQSKPVHLLKQEQVPFALHTPWFIQSS